MISGGAYRVVTHRGGWRCRTVVIVSGACNLIMRLRNSSFIDGSAPTSPTSQPTSPSF